MNITIVGAGNIGLAITAYLCASHKGCVTLFTGRDIESLRLHDVEKGIYQETNDYRLTSDPEAAFSKSDIILVTYPAFLRKKFIENNRDFIPSGSSLGFVPGYGGAEYFCSGLISRGITVFGFQRVPYVARTTQDNNGVVAGILSSKKELYVGAIPQNRTAVVSRIVEQLFDIPTRGLQEYLSITLAPSNPLLHITGLYNVFKDYDPGQKFDSPMKFYEEWNDDASELLFKYDAELQSICKNLSPLDMREVIPLPIYYESPTPQAMTRKLKSIEAFKAVMVPLKESLGGYIPDLSSRMFVEDFPYGVCIIKDFARLLNVSTPTVDMLLGFYERLSGHKYFNDDGSYSIEIANTGVPGTHGMKSKQDIIQFYHI